MTSGCQTVWQRPSPLLPTFDLFDLKYFCVYEVQAIRVAVLSSLRRYHGQRIKLDRSGASAVKTSLDLRLSWARGEWISLLNETVELFRNKEQLRKLNVIQFVGADSPDEASQARPNQFLVEALEAMVRCLIGLYARSMTVWGSSYYSLVKLVSPIATERTRAAAEAAHLWRNTLFLEEMTTNEDVDAGVLAVSQEYFAKDLSIQ